MQSGANACEVALWAQWEHRGRLIATQYSELVTVSSLTFRKISCRSSVFDQCREYTRLYAAKVREEFGENWRRLPDIWLSEADVLEMSSRAFETVDITNSASFSRSAVESSHCQTKTLGLIASTANLGQAVRDLARRMTGALALARPGAQGPDSLGRRCLPGV